VTGEPTKLLRRRSNCKLGNTKSKCSRHIITTCISVVLNNFGPSAFNTVVCWRWLGEVEVSAPHVNLSFVLSVCQKLSNSVDIWRTCDKNNFAQFFLRRGVDVRLVCSPCRAIGCCNAYSNVCIYATVNLWNQGFRKITAEFMKWLDWWIRVIGLAANNAKPNFYFSHFTHL